MSPCRGAVAALACAIVLGGCTLGAGAPEVKPSATSSSAQPTPEVAMPPEPTTVVPGDTAVELAIATSRALYRHAPTVVLVAEDDHGGLTEATAKAVSLGVPLLVTPAGDEPSMHAQLRDELQRLAPRQLVTVGDAAARWARDQNARTGDGVGPEPIGVRNEGNSRPLADLLVLALERDSSRAAVATAQAAGARVLLLPDPDPRAHDQAIRALASQPTDRVLALGSAFGPADRLRYRIDTAATGVQLPGGGQVVFPGRRMVALYGHPGDARLGCLGEQSVDAAVKRAKQVAAQYSALVDEPVVPAFEIIATVASSSAGPDGDYSSESSISHLRPWVDAAREAGIYVVLDLQPGRTDFLTQAKRYRELLLEPHVGLALDPEWRLKPGQRHLVQIGSVTAQEINMTAAWLAELTREHRLPQKVLMVHQFRLDMITDRLRVKTDYDELQVVIHADGFGTPGQKMDTWRALHRNPPADVWWGWKNFYDEDQPTFTPRQTIAVEPSPVFISYQ